MARFRPRWWWWPVLFLVVGALYAGVQYARYQWGMRQAFEAVAHASAEHPETLIEAGVTMAAEPLGALAPAFGVDVDRVVASHVGARQPRGLGGLPTEQPDAASSRHLVRSGTLHVEVEDYGGLAEDLGQWLLHAGGYVSQAAVQREGEEVTFADLLLRVPVDRLDDLLSWLEERTLVTRLDLRTEEVTEKWVDLEARVANARRTEAELVALANRESHDLEDLLRLEGELTRVREQIERHEGRQRVLGDQVSLASVRLHVVVPEEEVVAAAKGVGLGRDLARSFTSSATTLASAMRTALLLAAVALPWLLFVTALSAGGALAWRWARGPR